MIKEWLLRQILRNRIVLFEHEQEYTVINDIYFDDVNVINMNFETMKKVSNLKSGRTELINKDVIPNILRRLGSYVVTDPKGELYDKTHEFMEENGYIVKK